MRFARDRFLVPPSSFPLAISVLFLLHPSFALAEEAPPSVSAFLTRFCVDCHRGEEAEGEFDVGKLEHRLLESANDGDSVASASQIDAWRKVADRVIASEMPPSDADLPSTSERQSFLGHLHSGLQRADRRRQDEFGRGVIRRLNRTEFENTLSDLLGIPLHVRGLLPPDATGEGFDTVGDALNVSAVQMESYLAAIDAALDEATKLIPQPPRKRHRLSYRQTTGMMTEYRRTGPFLPVDDGVAMFAPDFFSHFNSLLDTWVVPHSARYRVRVSAYAIRNQDPVTLTVRMGGPGHKESDAVRKQLLGNVSVVDQTPTVYEFDDYLQRGQMLRIYPSSLRKMRFAGKQWEMRQEEYEGPAVVVQWVEVDGPIYESWPPPSHQRLYAGIPVEPIEGVEPNPDPNAHLDGPPNQIAKPRLSVRPRNQETGNRFYYDPKQKWGGEKIYRRTRVKDPLHPTLRLAPADASSDAERLIRDFAANAYRRPVAENTVIPYVDLVHHWLNEGADFEQAVRVGYKAILVSTDFLYHQAKSGHDRSDSLIDEHALAERLAYFLWNSPPDQTLREIAEQGRLRSPEILHEQVERMLDDPRAERFADAFLGQWLELRNIDFTSPDSMLYPEFNPLMKWSMVQESKHFFTELIRKDLSADHLIDSDFLMINDCLARLYQIDGVKGVEFRKVALPDGSYRGGVLTQAAVLKVTANGTTTSPVVRGVWVMERLLGQTPEPPPPGVSAIEPDLRGATTVREQLEAHRQVESCASCHRKIDPPGVALESFDVIGGLRTHYRAIQPQDTDRSDPYTPAGERPIRYERGPAVDPADVTADGDRFDDVREFKKIVLENPDGAARAIATKLLIYGTGAPVSYADEVALDRLVEQSRRSGHGMRSLLHHVVSSQLFQEK